MTAVRYQRIAVLGGGAWGTALAVVAARAGRAVRIWARDPDVVAAIDQSRENPRYLPDITLDHIPATTNIGAALRADAVLLAVPAQATRSVAAIAAPYLAEGHPLVICAKGLETGTAKRMSEVLADAAPDAPVAVLSGPGFATDVAQGLPTAVTIAASDERLARDLCQSLASRSFRPYAETDLIGVELGGAVKNVLAIAAGIVAGRRLGASALAALIARGFAEMRRLAAALGARAETLMGLSGLGDLVLTCSGPQSRNFAYGQMLGEGGDPNDDHPLVEGIATASVARDLARRHRIAMPIVDAVAAIVGGNLTIDAAIEALMTRPLKHETE
ncbi:NAD(P)H-dependent glycerol-3-phosphate dehydrogenase [Bauldia sp.]|uniref:NAD(P)H-dependent glycerol-3-phosphate dehydrogenase n=1 Tax=Bauldia sp. TaxID=2575872 RepID=UPI003BA8B921